MSKIDQAAADALRERGLDADLLTPHVAALLVEAEDGTVKSKNGRSPLELVDEMPKHPTLGKYFVGTEPEKPSWEGKKYSEMTVDEKIEFTNAQYEKGAYR